MVDAYAAATPDTDVVEGSAVCLFTDVANPTSNKIYAAIGYEAVADFVRYDFS